MPLRNCWQRRALVCMIAATLGLITLRIKAGTMASLALLSCKKMSLGVGHGNGDSDPSKSKTARTLAGLN
jgi:hypothetical protein